MNQAIGYYRVSTAEQGRSRLGLEAQRDAVVRFCETTERTLIDEFTEVETGKGHDALTRRPILAQAIERARAARCPIVVAKLDRLGRDVHFISGLMVHRVQFRVASIGDDVDPFMLHIYAAVAQQERNLISIRTQEALRRVKERGITLGNPNGPTARAAARVELRRRGDATAVRYTAVIAGFIATGYSTNAEIANAMNHAGVNPPRSGRWHAMTVARIRSRINTEEKNTMIEIPAVHIANLGPYGAVVLDNSCGEPVAWGRRLTAREHLGNELFDRIARECGGQWYYIPTGGPWVLVHKWLTANEAVTKYGPVVAETNGPRGGFKSVMYGNKIFTSRCVRPDSSTERAVTPQEK